MMLPLLGLLASCELQSPTSVDSGNAGTALPFGKEVTVQFNRNALGAAASLPVPPEALNQNGVNTSLRGKLMGISEDWIEIQFADMKPEGTALKSYWIPKQSVLLIQYDEYKAK